MGYDITIGKVIDFYFDEIVNDINDDECSGPINYKVRVQACEGTEPKGITSKEFTLYKGPQRAPSYTGWHSFMRQFASLKKLEEDYINPKSSDGWTYLLNVNIVKNAIDQLENEIKTTSVEPVNMDRANWLIYWVRQSVALYGNKAAITFR